MNGYDNFITQWIDYWAHWHYPDEESPYTFKMDGDEVDDALEYDLVKAICYKESTMGQVNLMQVFDPAINALEGPENERDWNWNAQPVATDPEKGSLYDMGDASPFMDYNAVAVSSHSESIKWGVRYLYSIKSKASYDYYAGCQDCSGKMYNPQWLSWMLQLMNTTLKKIPTMSHISPM